MSTLQTSPSSAPLSTLMRDGSRAEHTAAEGSSYMASLLDGQVNEQGYADYLLRLRQVYAALETVGRELAATDPLAAAVHDPALERLAAIDADLDHWLGSIGPGSTGPGSSGPGSTGPGSTGPGSIGPGSIGPGSTGSAARAGEVDSPATKAYVERLEASREWGGLYAAHHYTRYLGDLSGGQAIGRTLDRTFGLDGRGIAFYDFPEVPKPKPYKDGYRARLDGLGLDADQKARVVDEVKVAFGLNQAIFEELSGHLAAYRR